MTGPGRPRVGERIEVRLPDDLLVDIKRISESEGASLAETLRHLLRCGVVRHDEFND